MVHLCRWSLNYFDSCNTNSNILDFTSTRGGTDRIFVSQNQNDRIWRNYSVQQGEGRKTRSVLTLLATMSSRNKCIGEILPGNRVHQLQYLYLGISLLHLLDRTLLWPGALLRSPLPPPQPGQWSPQDPRLSGQDRRRRLAQLPHRADQPVRQGYSGRSGQRLHCSRSVRNCVLGKFNDN